MNASRLIRRGLLIVAVVALGATVAVFIGYRRTSQDPQLLLDSVPKGVDMQLNKIRQTAMKHGIKEWQLEAESVAVANQDQTMVLTRPDVLFFMQDGSDVHMTAASGTIHTDSNRIEVSGQVAARSRDYRLVTEAIDYDPKKRELVADQPVTLTGQRLTLTADRMTIDLDANTTRFDGNVKGVIDDDLQL